MALVIPAHTRIDGLVETSGDLAIEGTCAGTLSVGGTITVAKGASCRASIRARGARIAGEVIGHVVCSDSIQVAGGARVVGDLRAPEVSVDAASDVDGKVDLLPPEAASAPIRRAPVATRGPRPGRPVAPARPIPVAAGGDPAPHTPQDPEATAPAPASPPVTRAIPTPPRPPARTRVRRRDAAE